MADSLRKNLFRNRAFGLSLLEVVIAIAILVVSVMGIVQVIRQGGVTTEAFSSEHFTAMFLAQKVIEDIHHQLEHNPHYFSELVAISGGSTARVIDGEHSLFRLLENTRNFTYLAEDDDGPIDSSSGKIYHQLKNFQIKMATQLIANPATGDSFPNLLDLHLTILWDTSGRKQKYELVHSLAGVSESQFGILASPDLPSFSDSEIGESLWVTGVEESLPAQLSLNSFLAQNGGQIELVKEVGQLFRATDIIYFVANSSNQEIEKLRSERDAAIASSDINKKIESLRIQEQIGQQFQHKAAIDISVMVRAYNHIKNLSQRNITFNSVGSLLKDEGGQIIYACLTGMTAISRATVNLQCAEAEFGKLLSPPFSELLAERRQTMIIRQILDQMKLRALIAEDETSAIKILKDLQQTIKAQQTAYLGKIPAFVAFLAREAEITASPTELRKYFGGNSGLSEQARRLREIAPFLTTIARTTYAGIGVAKPVELTELNSLNATTENTVAAEE